MKIPALLVALALTSLSVCAAEKPVIPIDAALKTAMTHLAERGLADQHFIGSLTLEDTSIMGGKQYWFARWSPSIKLEGRTESGLRINMDGSLVRITARPLGKPSAASVERAATRNLR